MNLWSFLLVCGSVWLCFQLLAVLVGWRLTAMRGVAVVEWQDCDKQERTEWDYADVEAVATLVREATTSDDKPEDDEPDHVAHDFILWRAELNELPGVHKHLRRMDRWSA